jgi:hypothetical protein
MLVEASSPLLATEDGQPIRPPVGTAGLVEDVMKHWLRRRGITTRQAWAGWGGCSTRGQPSPPDP